MPVKFDRSLIPPSPDLSFENALWTTGVALVAGIDEAGRGALAGPVAAAALILPPDPDLYQALKGVRDSKQMTADARSRWAVRLADLALAWAVGFSTNHEIDAIGILAATRLAVQRALQQLCISPQHLLVDYLELPECPIQQTALVKGDARSLSIAAASIMAKTSRDEALRRLEQEFPGYGFAEHKGYGTAAHRQAIQILGYSAVHRLSFQIHSNTRSE